ncbi:hypothetical protein Clacol_002436 [Clathrus columnatus]|uniref:F-box domain-containing protein n=1 Tax=Clathrus columnatus TaxID=1419009 RepID=A0AAV5A3N8_9AGAM|nr:hypothetical protein Clacol_002436 [Clathrus columnatus]
MSSSLPFELLRPIVEHVNEKNSLVSLTQVSPSFQVEAERALYRSVILHYNDMGLISALSSPKRALLVQECSLYLAPGSKGKAPSTTTSIPPAFLVLSKMKNLKSLTIRGNLPSKPIQFPFSLDTFCTTEAMSKTLVSFLRTQPSITRLTLLSSPLPTTPVPPPKVVASMLPNAHSLATLTPQAALPLIPSKPVSHVHILAWAKSHMSDVAPVMASSSGPMRALMCAQGFELTPTDMGLLAMHIPTLTFLGDVVLTEDISAYTPALSRMPNLKTILVSRQSATLKESSSPSSPLSSRAVERNTLATLGRACRSLEKVAFTQMCSAPYVWERSSRKETTDEWVIKKVDEPTEVAGSLWKRS